MALFGKPLADSILLGLSELEQSADLQFDLPREYRREIVGLGFGKAEGREREVGRMDTLSWVELENVLPKADQHNEFRVDGNELRFVLQRAGKTLGLGERDKVQFVLWHSHYVNRGPSKVDLQHFPAWLVSEAIVYHAPTQTSTRYTAAGHLL